MTEQSSTGMKKTLGLTGVTVNAMALIAPGAFLWMTYQLQAASVDAAGNSTALDMWTGIVAALIVAFLTAFAFAELAHKYPEAGTGSSYYFAEKAFIDREEPSHRRWARLAKFFTGWAAHLFYWVYPGVMVAFFAVIVGYVVQQVAGAGGISDFIGAVPTQIGICIIFSIIVGVIAWRGISGSTNVAIAINVIQLVALVGFSIMAIAFRISNPLHVADADWYHPVATSIITPHNLSGLLFQSTIAILILVGFESSTALAAETINPKRDIPRGVILSLVIQGLCAYLFEYFAANYAMISSGPHAFGTGLGYGAVAASAGTAATPESIGIAAAGLSSAPLGDLIKQIGSAFFSPQVGFILMIITAITVIIAILGTTLAAMNTGVRISFAMAQDDEMPELLGMLHGKYATPHMGIVVMVIVSAIIGAIGVAGGAVTLTGITLASNLGTFVLYGLICMLTIVAFIGTKEFKPLQHMVIPVLGLIGNIIMVGTIFIVGITSGGTTAQATYLGLGISGVWLLVSVAYFIFNSRAKGKHIVPPVSAMTGAAGK
jgi:amino acid transporter